MGGELNINNSPLNEKGGSYDQVIKIDRYLTESEEITKLIQTEENMLLVSECGTGKTYATIKALGTEPFIFLVPSTTTKEQIAKEYNLACTNERAGIKSLIARNEFQIVACYESIQKVPPELLRNYVLVLDECHSLILDLHYRDNTGLLHLKDYFKGIISLTATPQSLLFEPDKAIKVESNHKLNVSVSILQPNGTYFTKLQERKVFDMAQKTPGSNLYCFSSCIDKKEKALPKELEIIHSGNKKDHKTYESLIEGVLPPGLTVSTNLFNAGLSFYNEGEVTLYIDFQGYDVNISNYIQLISRFRKADKINVYVYLRGAKKEKATNELILSKGKELVEKLNRGEVTLEQLIALNHPLRHLIKGNLIEGYSLNENKIKLAKQLYNGAKESSFYVVEEMCKKKGWEFLWWVLPETLEETDELVETKINGKRTLKELFVTDGQLNDFAESYFKYRLTKEKSLLNEYKDECLKLKELAQQKPVKKALDRVVQKIKFKDNIEVLKILRIYFAVAHKFDDVITSVTPEDKIRIQKHIVKEIEKDDTRLSKVRHYLEDSIQGFIPSHVLTENRKVIELLKWLGVKCSRSKKLNGYVFMKKGVADFGG